MPTFHLRVRQPRVKGRPGYSAAHFARVSGYEQEVDTVCGEPPTDHDVTRPKELVDWQEWRACLFCKN